jgi:hypothetical protein
MTSDTSSIRFTNNLELLPVELYYKTYEFLTVEELFRLNRMQLQTDGLFLSLSSYIDYYLEQEKYKAQDKLKDCMFLIMLDEYRNTIFSYLYDLVTDIGFQFYNDVEEAGGPISYRQLSEEENPRDIYTIKITSMINSDEYEYIITSVGGSSNNTTIYYNFGHINRPKNTQFISYNQPNITDTIIDSLLHIIDIMRLDNRKIKSIKYYKEKYSHNFLRNKLPILYFDEGYNLL